LVVAPPIGAIGVYLCLEFFCVRIEFDDECIYTFSPWRARRRIPWDAILQCRHSDLNQWYVLVLRSQGTIRVSRYMCGAEEFLAKLETMRGIKTSGLAPEPDD
jgi:hypothetical protein